LSLKAENTDLTATDARVTTVETTLNALDIPSITQSVQDVKFISKAQDQIAETQLRDILTGENTYTTLDSSIARAEQRLTAYTDGEVLAEATARLELDAQLQDTQAQLTAESIARATGDSALASDITTLQTVVGNNTAAIQTESTARVNADSALASQISILSTSVGSNTAAIVSEATARADADSALATDILGLKAVTGANIAAIQAETVARTDADSALASDITTLQSTVGNNTTSIQTTATTVDGIQGKYAVKIDNNGYVSGYGLISTANNATPFAEFAVIADRFSIAPVATNPDAVDGSPFFVLTAPQTINGVTVPAGTYMKQAFIYDAVITRAKIADLAVDNAKINDLNASKINAGFISADRIETGSIDAKIATINEAQIGNAQVSTLKIAGNAVTVPSFFSTTSQFNFIYTNYANVLTGSVSYSREQPLVFTFTTGIGGGASDSTLNSVPVTLDMEIEIRSTSSGARIAGKQVIQAVTIPPAAVSSVSGACVFFPNEIAETSINFSLRAKMVESVTAQRRGLFARAPATVVLETKR
jgi:hypothetical protein